MNSPARFPRSNQRAWLKQHGPFTVILAVYVVTAVWLAYRIPAFAMPNEPLHYEHVALILRTGRLPDPATSTRMDERHQPPVYYTLAALAGLALPSPPLDTDFPANPYYLATHEGNRNALTHATPQTAPVLYAGRLLSMCFGILCLVSVYVVACRSLTRSAGVLIVSLTAFQPMFLFLSASLNNDLAVTAMSALVIAYTSTLGRREGISEKRLGVGVSLFAGRADQSKCTLPTRIVAPHRRSRLAQTRVRSICALGPGRDGRISTALCYLDHDQHPAQRRSDRHRREHCR